MKAASWLLVGDSTVSGEHEKTLILIYLATNSMGTNDKEHRGVLRRALGTLIEWFPADGAKIKWCCCGCGNAASMGLHNRQVSEIL